jgi:uncharacterized protein involved in exopolysaccharide biosynthesis
VVVTVTLVTVAVAVAAGLAQAPTYTSSADINVGRVDVRVQTLPGYVAGAQALAAAYSRVATSDEVVNPLARRLGLSPAQVRLWLGATPVPNGTSFRIFGTGPSEREAVNLTRAAAAQMESYVKSTDDSKRTLDDVLGDYREQARTSAGLRQRIEDLRDIQQRTSPNASTNPSATPTPTSRASRRARQRRADEIARLQVALDTAQLKMQTLGGRYQERGNELAATAGIQIINQPVAATGDRRRTVERLAVIGLIAGVLLGAALALLVDRRRSSP